MSDMLSPSSRRQSVQPSHPSGTWLPRTRNDKMLAKVLGHLREQYLHAILPANLHVLVDNNSGEAFPLDVMALEDLVRRTAFEAEGVSVKKSVLQDAVSLIKSSYIETMSVGFGRSVRDADGSLYVVTDGGCLVYPHQGQGYKRARSIEGAALVMPTLGKVSSFSPGYGSHLSIQGLTELLRRSGVEDGQAILVMAWMVSTLIPDASKVMLELVGSSHSRKLMLQEMLKRLLDDCHVLSIDEVPSSRKGMSILSQQHFVISLEDVDDLPKTSQRLIADFLKGTDVEWRNERNQLVGIANVSRPFVSTSSGALVTEHRLIERSLSISLPDIKESRFSTLDPIGEAAAQNAYVSLMGLLGEVVHRFSSCRLSREVPETMRDFCRIGCLIAEAIGEPTQVFWDAYDDMDRQRREWELEENPVAQALRDYMEESSEACVEKTVGGWWKALEPYRPDVPTSASWPSSSRHMGSQLSAITDLMASVGLQIVSPPKRGGYCYYQVSRVKPKESTMAEWPKSATQEPSKIESSDALANTPPHF